MKLRCTQNSIRIRIRKSDLSALAENGRIREEVHLGGQQVFGFVLEKTKDTAVVQARMEDQTLFITLPETVAESWMNSNQVGIEVNQVLENGEPLQILIEKDFPCLDRENEDKTDTFSELVPDQPDAC